MSDREDDDKQGGEANDKDSAASSAELLEATPSGAEGGDQEAHACPG